MVRSPRGYLPTKHPLSSWGVRTPELPMPIPFHCTAPFCNVIVLERPPSFPPVYLLYHLHSLLLTPLVTKCVCVGGRVSTIPSHSLGHQLGVLQFYAVLILSPWRKCHTPQVKGSVPGDHSPQLQMTVASPGGHLCF